MKEKKEGLDHSKKKQALNGGMSKHAAKQMIAARKRNKFATHSKIQIQI